MSDCASAGQACNLEMGYDMFEFYSDRIPFETLTFTLDNGGTFTNITTITVHVDFKDDLSGLRSSSVTFEGSSMVLNPSDSNSIPLVLSNGEGIYPLFFTFSDRAGNTTTPSDRTRHHIGSNAAGDLIDDDAKTARCSRRAPPSH